MTMDKERKNLGKRINQARKDRGITSDKLSELCNINATYLRQIEGSGKTPSLPVFISICNALKVSANFLLQDELDVSEISRIEEIEALWESAEPSQYELVVTMLRVALRHIEGDEDASE